MSKPTIAVVGASSDRSKYSNKAVRAYLDRGWDVYPVNPKPEPIEGLKAFASVDSIPVKLQRVTLYLPPQLGTKVLPAIAAAAPSEFFVNPGADSPELVHRAEKMGLEPILACSIVDLGVTPADYPD